MTILILAMTLGGCVSWQVSPETAPQVIASQQPSQIRLMRSAGDVVVVRRPTIRGDSVVALDSAATRIAVPLADIRRVEVRRISGGRTGFLILGFVASAVIAIKRYAQSISS